MSNLFRFCKSATYLSIAFCPSKLISQIGNCDKYVFDIFTVRKDLLERVTKNNTNLSVWN